MGVHGLWRLLEPSGKPVPLDTLENKVLAVDVSIWLHQAIKGFQDSKGAPLPNAHLLGIYHRVCKLLYFRVRPVFVFDGGVPALKRDTIAKRSQLRTKNFNEANRAQKQLLEALLKHSAVNKILSEKTKASLPSIKPAINTDTEDLYKLPPSSDFVDSSPEEDSYTSETDSSPTKQWDLHTIDEKSVHFRSLPVEVRHEILTDLKETRKQSSWGRIHELPKQRDDFSIYQMNRLLKRHSVQVCLEEAEKEMGGHSLSLGELESLLNDHGVITSTDSGKRIASDENTRFLFVKDVKKAMEDARKLQLIEEDATVEDVDSLEQPKDSEFENDLKTAIQLSMQEGPSTSKQAECSFIERFNDDDFESSSNESEETSDVLTSAKNYMMEYSGLTPNEIAKILGDNTKKQKAKKSAQNPENLVELEPKNAEVDKASVETNNVTVEFMSDSSDSDGFVDVSDATLQVKINPNASLEHDLFSDVFNKAAEEKPKALEIVINPESGAEEDLFSDVFTDAKSKADNKIVIDLPSTREKLVVEDVIVEPKERAAIETKIVSKHTEAELKAIEIRSIVTKFIEDNSSCVPSSSTSGEIEPNKPILSTDQLQEIQAKLELQTNELIVERSNKERMSKNITDQMYQEAQELLELFGVPYIIAPMEAEAQCAFFDESDLTDGTITDDSDIWLFGGKTVYKNFFNQGKHVMEFNAENIKHNFKLSREQMILLALLVGSDYTTGLQGVGPVTALEILAAFPCAKTETSLLQQLLSGLREFRSWLSEGKKVGPGRTALKSKLKNVALTQSFPSSAVVQAYLEPKVESSKEKFTWSKPDLVGLMDFAKEKFGWTQKKSEEILKPLVKRLEEKHSQKSIKDYFKIKHKLEGNEVEKKLSKRVKKAIGKLGQEKGHSSDEDIQALKATKTRSKKKLRELHNEIDEKADEIKRTRKKSDLHKKEPIPQKEKLKSDALKTKLKAIEVFRKSKRGPGYVKKQKKHIRPLDDDAGLSESSSE